MTLLVVLSFQQILYFSQKSAGKYYWRQKHLIARGAEVSQISASLAKKIC